MSSGLAFVAILIVELNNVRIEMEDERDASFLTYFGISLAIGIIGAIILTNFAFPQYADRAYLATLGLWLLLMMVHFITYTHPDLTTSAEARKGRKKKKREEREAKRLLDEKQNENQDQDHVIDDSSDKDNQNTSSR
jgi:hypothetical protein